MQTSIKEVYDGLNGIDEVEFGMSIDRDDHIEYMGELWISGNGLIFTEVNENFMYPVTNAL